MAGPTTRGAGSGAGEWSRTSGAVTAIPSILLLLLLGLLLRIVIAYLLLPGSGFPNDLASFAAWGGDIGARGPLGFYERQTFIDYPPVYLLLLGVIGFITNPFGGFPEFAVKWVPILSDLLLAVVVWRMAEELGASRRRALVAAVFVVVNPITWINSAIWGQADVVGTIILLLGLRALIRDQRELAAALAVVATLTKIQLGILGVLVALVVLRRSLLPRAGERRDPARVLTSLASGLVAAGACCLPFVGLAGINSPTALITPIGLVSIVLAPVVAAGIYLIVRRSEIVEDPHTRGILALVFGVVAGLAFALIRFDPIVQTIAKSFGEYPYLTLNTYNPWALFTDQGNGMATTLSWVADSAWSSNGQSGPGFLIPTPFGGIPASIASEVVLLAVLALVGLWAALHDSRRSLAVALAVMALAFFVIPTRAHERYLYPFFGVAGLLLAVSWRWRAAYIVLAIADTANLVGVLTENPYNGVPVTGGPGSASAEAANFVNAVGASIREWHVGLPGPLADLTGAHSYILPIAAVAITTAAAMIWGLLQLRRGAVESLEVEAAAAAFDAEPWASPDIATPESGEASPSGSIPPPAGRGPLVEPSPAAALSPAAAFPLAVAAADGSGDAWEDFGAPVEAYEPEPELVPGPVMRAWRWLSTRSIRPDRSAALDVEPRGRLDRLDLWLVVVLAVSALTLRTYRLDEPLQMYFDEIYHARTGAEFLQDWRYGTPHGIYEYTHPHLAKYAIAAGLTLFSNDRVTSTSSLGTPVLDAVVQPRAAAPAGLDPADPRAQPGARLGDRVYVATGSEVRAYDLQTRELVASVPVPGAARLSLGSDGLLYAATTAGAVYSIDTVSFDDMRLDAGGPPVPAKVTDSIGGQVTHLYAGATPLLLAADAAGNVVSFDLDTKRVVARTQIEGASDFAFVGSGGQTFVGIAGAVDDPAGEAKALASAVGGNASTLEQDLRASGVSGTQLKLRLPGLDADKIAAIQRLIDTGKLSGVVGQAAAEHVLVASGTGLSMIDARTMAAEASIDVDGGVTGIDLESGTDTESYAASGSTLTVFKATAPGAEGKGSIVVTRSLHMPGAISRVYLDPSNKILQALGHAPDGQGWTMYAVETAGLSVFSDARLPFEPVAWGADVAPQTPNVDRQAMLEFSPDGTVASVDIGGFTFAWRIMGVLFGVLMAVCLYLLARVLFRRRSVGLLVALFALADTMLFAQSRIAMNDSYVGAFLVAGYLVFALIWMGVWRGRRALLLGMPLAGILLGLALASKWVALYAIASIGFLILIRSALGRLIVLLALVAITGVLGYLALSETPYPAGVSPSAGFMTLIGAGIALAALGGGWAMRARSTPDRVLLVSVVAIASAAILGLAWTMAPATTKNGGPNYTFFLIMLAVTCIAAAVMAYRPVAWTREEMRFAAALPVLPGAALLLLGWRAADGARSLLGLALIAGGPIAVWAAFWLVGRWGFGPLALPPDPDDPSSLADPPSPAPEGWLRLGSGRGLPAIWTAVCLLALPLAVYVGSYLPWAQPWQAQTPAAVEAYGANLPVLVCFKPDPSNAEGCLSGWPNGHTGQPLTQLTVDMYNYHNNLRSPHAASSPWWAWPLDLKPVWFESVGFAEDTGSMIYDAGNVVLWWLALPAMAFLAWQAYRRRSLALTLIGMAFFWQWLSWSRIDRASFQYHFYTALPFYLLALAYFVAELWHGPSRRTWLLARVSAAVALILAPLLWLLKFPLCSLARVDLASNADNLYYHQIVCGGPTGGLLPVTTQQLLISLVLIGALAALAIVLFRLERRQAYGEAEGPSWLLQLAIPAVVAGALILWLGANAPTNVIASIQIQSDAPALLVLLILLLISPLALRARDPRRFVAGVCVVVVVAFVALYPNVSALPMPDPIPLRTYNGFLPTWMYGFEFAVNGQVASPVQLLGYQSLLLTGGVLFVTLVVAYAAWVWRVIVGYRRHRAMAEAFGSIPPAPPAPPAPRLPAGEGSR